MFYTIAVIFVIVWLVTSYTMGYDSRASSDRNYGDRL